MWPNCGAGKVKYRARTRARYFLSKRRKLISNDVGRVDASFLREAFITPAQEFVQRPEIGLRRSDERIRIRALRRDGAAARGEPDRNLGLRVGSFGDSVDLIELELGLVRHQGVNRIEDRVHRTVTGRLLGDVLAVDVERQRGRLRAHGA